MSWVPITMQAQLKPDRDLEDQPWLWMFARLAPGATRASVQRELVALTESWVRDTREPASYQRYVGIRLTDLTGLPDDARRTFLGFTALLFGAALLVLIIASVNVASMLSARAVARRREMALRTALGAGRVRLVRQLLTESLVLFVLGSIGGVAVAWAATGALERIPIPGTGEALSLELSPDPRVMAFALVVSLATGLVFGLAPALQGVGRDIATRLRNETAGGGARRSLAGNALIVAQLALSLVLMVAAGLFTKALSVVLPPVASVRVPAVSVIVEFVGATKGTLLQAATTNASATRPRWQTRKPPNVCAYTPLRMFISSLSIWCRRALSRQSRSARRRCRPPRSDSRDRARQERSATSPMSS